MEDLIPVIYEKRNVGFAMKEWYTSFQVNNNKRKYVFTCLKKCRHRTRK
ncbi:MAG TPA: hypothetical protein PK106_06765 [Bacteroidales bacterium]|nr:hypothetical protein [Bacteroidales bacterium]